MRLLRSVKFLAFVSVVLGLGIVAWEQRVLLGVLAHAVGPMARRAAVAVGMCAAVVTCLAGTILVVQRVLVGLVCPVCGGKRLQHARIRSFGRRYYLCKDCGAHLLRHPVASDLVVMDDDRGVEFPGHGLRYPPSGPSPIPTPEVEAKLMEGLEGPPKSLATLVKAKHDRKRGEKGGTSA